MKTIIIKLACLYFVLALVNGSHHSPVSDATTSASRNLKGKRSQGKTNEQSLQPLIDLLNDLIRDKRDNAGGGRNEDDAIYDEINSISETITNISKGFYDFPVEKFDDASAQGASGNHYGWGGDYSDQCGVGVIFHSGGIPAIIEKTTSNPTMTLRDDMGDIIFQTKLNLDVYGLRSALVFDCAKNDDGVITMVEILSGTVVLGNEDNSSLLKFTVDLGDICINTTEDNSDCVTTETLLQPNGTSIRSMTRLDECHIAFAALTDTDLSITEVDDVEDLAIFTYNVCAGGDAVANILTGLSPVNGPVQRLFLWDFAIGDDGTVWVVAVALVPCQLPTGEVICDTITGLNLIPQLALFNRDQLITTTSDDDDETNNISVTPRPLSPDIPFSGYSILPINGGSNVLACTLSGFTYQFFFSNIDGGLMGIIPGFLSGQTSLSQFELGFAQQCYVCSDDPSDDCHRIDLPGQKKTSAYIWRLDQCGDHIFAGSLDVASIISDLIRERDLGSFMGGSRLEGSVELLLSQVISLMFNDRITPMDFGFDMWYIDSKTLEDYDSNSSATFETLTLDGFRQWESGSYSPLLPVQDGVRNLICHTGGLEGHKLVVGSADLNYDKNSVTFVLDGV